MSFTKFDGVSCAIILPLLNIIATSTQAKRSTKEVLLEIGCSPDLIGVLTGQWGDYGLPPGQSSFAIQAMIARHYFEGGNYPIGGSRMIAETIIPGIQSKGGKVILSCS